MAPSSQSLNDSSSQTVTRTDLSGVNGRTVRVERERTTEVRRTRPVSVTQTSQSTSDSGKSVSQENSRSDAGRQSRDRISITGNLRSTENQDSTKITSSVTTADIARSQKTVVSAPSRDNSRSLRKEVATRHEGRRTDLSNLDSAAVKTNETNTRSENRDRPARSQEGSRTPSVAASGSDNAGSSRINQPQASIGQSDNRWSRLRSQMNSDSDRRSREGRSDRDSHIRRDEDRGRVVVNDNNISVQRGSRSDHHRPNISRHLFHDIKPIHRDHRWSSHGSSFIYRWSDRSCGRVILAPYHDYYGISYYYPSYHRKYLFVSLGGYWPYSYRYQRYYWYGCHPYYWYGSYVVPSTSSVVYDYTTYNYYTTYAPAAATEVAAATDLVEDASATDAPMPQSQADINFANAVNAFDEGRYEYAAELFREAILQSPDDEIIPFTYTQALFASGDYALAAYVLREAMTKMPADEPAVYFPRGLYKDDQILLGQIAQLESAIVVEPFSTDYQLLLGYQYLGIGQWDNAVNALSQAARNPLNAGVVTKLVDIAEKMEKDTQETVPVPQS